MLDGVGVAEINPELFVSEYLAWLASSTSMFAFPGLPAQLPIADAWVDLRALVNGSYDGRPASRGLARSRTSCKRTDEAWNVERE